MSTAGPIIADRLKSFIERVEKLLEERQAIQSDIKDVFAEAKGIGYDVKTMRKMISLRAMDAADRDEAQALIDTYAHALGMEYTAAREPTEDELAEKASRIIAEVDQCMALVGPNDEPPKIAAIEALIGCSCGKASKLRGMVMERVDARISRSRPNDREMENEIGAETPPVSFLPSPNAWQEVSAVRDDAEKAWAAEAARIAAEKEAEKERKRLEREAEKARNRAITEDPLEHPAFLVRTAA